MRSVVKTESHHYYMYLARLASFAGRNSPRAGKARRVKAPNSLLKQTIRPFAGPALRALAER
jgi:hypothetical protein